MESKKNLTTLLIIFGIVLVASGAYLFYFSREDVSVNWTEFFMGKALPENEMKNIESAKRLTEDNLKNFIKNNQLDNLVDSPQYQNLVDPNITIDIGQVSNPKPFTKPKPLTEE